MVEYLIELSQFEEEDLFQVVLFNIPVLLHCWSELVPLIFRDVESGAVIVRIFRSASLDIPDVFFFKEEGQSFFYLFNRSKASTDYLVLMVNVAVILVHSHIC